MPRDGNSERMQCRRKAYPSFLPVQHRQENKSHPNNTSLLPQRLTYQSELSSLCDVPEGSEVMDKSVTTDLMQTELQELTKKIAVLKNEVKTLTEERERMQFKLANISHDDKTVSLHWSSI